MFMKIGQRNLFSRASGRDGNATAQDPLSELTSASFYDMAIREDGLLPGTLVDTENGWRPVESIRPGDMVMTFDHGRRPVVANRSVTLHHDTLPDRKAFVMFVPKSVLGNRSDLLLMPMQEVIIESDTADALYGDPFVLMPSLLLSGYRGIRKRAVRSDITLSMLSFEQEEVLLTQGDMLTLAHADSSLSPLTEALPQPQETFLRLPPAELRDLIDWNAAQGAPGPTLGGPGERYRYAAIEARAL